VKAMRSTQSWWTYGVTFALLAGLAAVIVRANRDNRRTPLDGSPQATWGNTATVTSRAGLQQAAAQLERRLKDHPTDAAAAVSLADVLMRQARVSGNAGLAFRAEQALKVVLHDDPIAYDPRRMLGAVYLSQHRFREAIREANNARAERPADDWNYGVMGDGHLELGEYDEAFAAFQKMMDLRPTAGAYARAAYALELGGRLEEAIEAMKLSTDATPPTDQESVAWHHAQLGDLYRQLGRREEAAFEYAWANHSFPNHPFAERGMAELMEANGDLTGALTKFEALMTRSPLPDVAEKLGDLYATLGRAADASRAYALAEAGWRFDAPQPAFLARYLAEHDLKLQEAVDLAEGVAADRHDIFTEDALAWCYLKSGRVQEAAAAIGQALRTGTKDPSILYHAAAITHALGDTAASKRLAHAALESHPQFDVRLAPAARVLAYR
jgi:tetratricopeptide (TPR) repeat protein